MKNIRLYAPALVALMLAAAAAVLGSQALPKHPVAKTPPPAEKVSSSVYLASPGSGEAIALYKQGLKLYYERKFQSALDLFNRALAVDPDCYQALNAKGATYAFLGRYDEGIALIRRAIDLQPNFEYAHFNLGLAYELAGRWNEAIAAYQSAIALNDRDEWAYYGIASIYGRQDNVSMVVKYLQKAIAIWSGVKGVARREHDFDPVRNDPRFQALLN